MCCTTRSGWTDTSNGCDGSFGGSWNHACALKLGNISSSLNCINKSFNIYYIIYLDCSTAYFILQASHLLKKEKPAKRGGGYRLALWPTVKPVKDICKTITHPTNLLRKRMYTICQKDVMCMICHGIQMEGTMKDISIPTTLVAAIVILQYFVLHPKVKNHKLLLTARWIL